MGQDRQLAGKGTGLRFEWGVDSPRGCMAVRLVRIGLSRGLNVSCGSQVGSWGVRKWLGLRIFPTLQDTAITGVGSVWNYWGFQVRSAPFRGLLPSFSLLSLPFCLPPQDEAAPRLSLKTNSLPWGMPASRTMENKFLVFVKDSG